jgi:hypothetical protein
MRWIIVTALLSSTAFGQAIDTGNGSDGACTEATIAGSGTFNCTTLTINASPNFTYGVATSVLIIKVQGAVTINASLTLNGENGSYGGAVNGGRGGPGASDGGGYFFGSSSSPDAPLNGGVSGSDSASCGGGGGAGSFTSLGSSGGTCPTGAAGGAAGLNTYDPFVSAFRGGFGGGSGGEGPPGDAGAGGGGGGSMHIMAGGDVLINANLSSRGGSGGSATGAQVGGPGGGGSGGVIWIQTLGQMTNNGSIDVSGGSGGTSPQGHRGGDGGNGVFKLEDADGVISGTGTGTAGSSSKLTSSISCGTMNIKDQNVFPQVGLGFFLVALFQFFNRKLKRFGYSQA